jgi:DNA-binding MurR/RpiR family transcriptional regulator
MDAVDRINESYPALTPTEQVAATYILGHLTDVLVSTSAELSQLSGISQPTLSRLYRKFGYKNASEFKHDIRRYHQPGAPEIAASNMLSRDPVHDQLQRDIESLTRTYQRLSAEHITGIANDILDATHVALIGFRNNYPMVLHLREQLIQSRPDVSVFPLPGQSLAEEVADLGANDLAILFGARRRTAAFKDIASALHESAVPMLIVGDSTARHVATANQASFIEADLNAGILSSYTAAFSLVALLANAVATLAQQHNGASDTRDGRIERINARFIELNELERASFRR